MKKELFKEKFILLQEYYNHQLTQKVTKLYWDRLKEIEDKEFDKIVNLLIDSEFTPTYHKKFPLIKDFVELTLKHFANENGADYLLRKFK